MNHPARPGMVFTAEFLGTSRWIPLTLRRIPSDFRAVMHSSFAIRPVVNPGKDSGQ